MPIHSHEFVESYDGFLGFGFDRETDEATVICYLQKFSDDRLMEILKKRLSNRELEQIFEFVSMLLKRHLTEDEYHELFLRDKHQ